MGGKRIQHKSNFKSRRRYSRPPQNRDGFRIHTNKRVRKLNMRRLVDFKWDLSLILKEVPEENVATMKGGIYAKASKVGVREARDFISDKEKEGVISPETALKLTKLLARYSVFR